MEKNAADAPLVSVLIITYQHEAYIAGCIESVLEQQTNFPFEIIIGTDCSPDGTDAIVREYADKYPQMIRAIFRERNLGALGNSRDILSRMRGKYLAVCDGDDQWSDPLKLQKQVGFLEANPDFVLVYTDIDQFYIANGKRVESLHNRLGRKVEYHEPDAWFEAILLRKAAIHSATICARADCWLAACRDIADILEDCPMGDTPSLLALTRYGNFGYLPESTALMNRLPESASRSRSHLKKAEFNTGSIHMQLAIAEKYGYSSSRLDDNLTHRVLLVLRLCVLGQGPEQAEALLRTLDGRVKLDWRHRLLLLIAKSRGAAALFKPLDRLAIKLRRQWRKFRYGIESSV